MAQTYLAEIRIFGFTFAPKGWAMCNGQTLSISQNTALFSLLGTTYGGNGKTTFQLPNLQGMVALQQGQGPNLTQYFLGEAVGAPTVSLQQTELPSHAHGVNADSALGNSTNPFGNLYKEGEIPGSPVIGIASYNTSLQPQVTLNPATISVTGGSQPHNNIMPTLVLNYCIALQGVYPPRT
jgi:microcystin-dependent protein